MSYLKEKSGTGQRTTAFGVLGSIPNPVNLSTATSAPPLPSAPARRSIRPARFSANQLPGASLLHQTTTHKPFLLIPSTVPARASLCLCPPDYPLPAGSCNCNVGARDALRRGRRCLRPHPPPPSGGPRARGAVAPRRWDVELRRLARCRPARLGTPAPPVAPPPRHTAPVVVAGRQEAHATAARRSRRVSCLLAGTPIPCTSHHLC